MKFLRSVKNCSILDQIKNEEEIESITSKTIERRPQWKGHFLRMEESRLQGPY